MTKSALEALVNALLAPSQPITANGMHKPSMQHVIDELYDANSRAIVLAGVTAALTMQAGDALLVIRAGEGRLIPFTALNSQRRGAYNASVDAYPSSGGSGTAGAILAGDWWYVSVAGDLDLGSGAETVPVKSIILALVDTPGTDPAKWRVI